MDQPCPSQASFTLQHNSSKIILLHPVTLQPSETNRVISVTIQQPSLSVAAKQHAAHYSLLKAASEQIPYSKPASKPNECQAPEHVTEVLAECNYNRSTQLLAEAPDSAIEAAALAAGSRVKAD